MTIHLAFFEWDLADTRDVLEAYKSQDGGKVFLYERKPLASTLTPSRLELVAQECK